MRGRLTAEILAAILHDLFGESLARLLKVLARRQDFLEKQINQIFDRLVLEFSLSEQQARQFSDWLLETVLPADVIRLALIDFLTPFSRNPSEAIPGVYLHAHAVSQILDTMTGERASIAFWNPLQEAFWVLGWSLVGGLLTWRFLRVKTVLLTVAIAVISLTGIGWLLFSYFGLWVPIIPPAIALLTTSGIFFFLRSYYLK